MEVVYDQEAQILYIYLTDKKSYFGIVDHSQELTDTVIVDWMKDGTPYGIEILGVDKVKGVNP